MKIWARAPGLKTSYKKPALEIYSARRYFTVTGIVLGNRREIRDAGDELVAIIAEEFPKVDRDRSPYDGPTRVLDIDAFLERASVEIFEIAFDGTAERKYAIRCPWVAEHTYRGGFTAAQDTAEGLHGALVEVIRGLQTSDETAAAISALAEDLGKTPAEARDFPGFVSNRILMPFINEACYALMEGVAEADAIDTIAKLGFAHPMGPLALADLIGLDTCVSILEVLHEGLGDPKYAPCPLLRQYVQAGRLGRKSGRGFYAY